MGNEIVKPVGPVNGQDKRAVFTVAWPACFSWQQYGEVRHELKDAPIPDGAFGHWSNAEYLYAFGLEDAADELKWMEELANAGKELEKIKGEKAVSQKMFRAI